MLNYGVPDPIVGLNAGKLQFNFFDREIVVTLFNELQSGAVDRASATEVRFTNDEYDDVVALVSQPNALSVILQRIVETNKIAGVSVPQV
jgi:hypothetical protein